MISSFDRYLRRVADEYAPDPRYLAVLRVVFGLWVIVFPVDLSWVAGVPADFVNPPPGFFVVLTAPPSEAVLVGLSVVKVILGLMVAVGVVTLPASIGLSIGMVVTSGIAYSFSKVDHFILFELAPIFLAYAGWGRTWSVDAVVARRRGRSRQVVRGLPVLLFAMTVGWAMFTAVVPKATGGWIDPTRQATRGYVARDIAQGEKLGPLGAPLLDVDSAVFWKFLDYATMIVEGGLVFLVLFPLLFRGWLVLVVLFHIGVFLALGINFADNLMAYAVFFSPVVVWAATKLSGSPREGERGEVASVRVNDDVVSASNRRGSSRVRRA